LANGNCNLVLNVQDGKPVKVPPMCAGLSATKSVADSLKKIAIFIEASNPTEVKLSEVELVHWVGDTEKYVTFAVENISNLPAEGVRIRILDAVKPNEKNSRILSFYPSKAYAKSALENLGISKGRIAQIPIASVSELSGIAQSRVTHGLDFMGVGISPKPSENLIESYVKSKGFSENYRLQTESLGFGVEITYKNVFGASNTLLTSFFVHYGKAAGA
jgi:hypothetical protein